MKNISIKKYGIEDENRSVIFSVDKVIELLVANADDMLKNRSVNIGWPNADMYASAELHEHGLIVHVNQFNCPFDSTKYDSCGEATIFIFDDEIDYVVSGIEDSNNPYSTTQVNSDMVAELTNKIGKSVEIDENIQNNSKMEKISLALSSKKRALLNTKRELLNTKRELVQLKKTIYISKLENLLSEEKKLTK